MNPRILPTILFIGSLVIGQSGSFTEAANYTIRVDAEGRRLQGKPLVKTADRIFLLGRDGQLWDFSAKYAANARRISDKFVVYQTWEMKSLLADEFGKDFDVTHTGNYLVVHPKGQRDRWAKRFEGLYKSLNHFFAVRGFRFKKPEFPLVAVVYPKKERFFAQAAKEGAKINTHVLGYYSPTTNRVLLYDVAAENPQIPWSQNAATIIHEATHQTAFNVGLHSRFGENPRWLVEGLGTLFEARGVWHSRKYKHRKDRINNQQLNSFRSYVKNGRQRGSLLNLISSDRSFSKNQFGAYGESWALTFYLTEKRHHQYFSYLRRVAKRPSFKAYTPQDRVQDFVDCFGGQLDVLEAQFLRFIDDLD